MYVASSGKSRDEVASAIAIQQRTEQRRLPKKRLAPKIVGAVLCVFSLTAFTVANQQFRPDSVVAASDVDETEATVPAGPTSQEPSDRQDIETKEIDQVTYWVDPASSQTPWTDEGLLTFRGNPTRTYYGQGPLPKDPAPKWNQPIGCSLTVDGVFPNQTTKQWCGTGWTGQPAVFKSPKNDGRWWVAVGAYNKAVNFYDAETGDKVFEPYFTEDIIKGSVTIDPDGYPLLYTGSRDGFFHIVAMDRQAPEQLWSLSAELGGQDATRWNDDWDSSALVIDDYLFIGGENSRFYIYKLNRSTNLQGLVTIAPEQVFSEQGWDSQLEQDLAGQPNRNTDLSIENSLAISGNTLYFANSGGLIQGWDISGVKEGETPTRSFRFWAGDDIDASIVVDKQGFLYAVAEYERGTSRADEIGQIIKLDPTNADDPLVWSKPANIGKNSGVWATPALYKDTLIVPTSYGKVLALDTSTGQEQWQLSFGSKLWASPVVIDDTLLQGDCLGTLHSFDLTASNTPNKNWAYTVADSGCIESTPAVWDGSIYVGSRGGSFYAIKDQ